MPDFVNNPRRTPRASIGCDARVALRDGRYFTGATVDCGPQGCQIVSPTPLSRDERIYVELRGTGVAGTFWFSGRVAWAADAPPFRAGVQFDDGSCSAARGFFVQLSDAHPDAASTNTAPTQLPLDALLVPGTATHDEALHPGEAELLRAVGDGIAIGALRERLGDRWEPSLTPLFSLLARGELRTRADDGTDTTH